MVKPFRTSVRSRMLPLPMRESILLSVPFFPSVFGGCDRLLYQNVFRRYPGILYDFEFLVTPEHHRILPRSRLVRNRAISLVHPRWPEGAPRKQSWDDFSRGGSLLFGEVDGFVRVRCWRRFPLHSPSSVPVNITVLHTRALRTWFPVPPSEA